MGILSSLGLVKEEPKKEMPKAMREAITSIKTPTPAIGGRGGGRRRAPEQEVQEETAFVQMDKAIEKQLEKAIASTGTSGFDFTNFAKMLDKNKNLGEATKYQTALSAADAMGTTPDELIESAQKAVKAVQTQSKKIELELSDLENTNRENQAELGRLNKQIEELQSRKSTLENTISKTADSIESGHDNLNNTVGVVVDEIRQVISNIKSYSKN